MRKAIINCIGEIYEQWIVLDQYVDEIKNKRMVILKCSCGTIMHKRIKCRKDSKACQACLTKAMTKSPEHHKNKEKEYNERKRRKEGRLTWEEHLIERCNQPKKVCSVEDCANSARVKGLCDFHHNRIKKNIALDLPKYCKGLHTKLCKCGATIGVRAELCQPCYRTTEVFLEKRRLRERGKRSHKNKLSSALRNRFHKAHSKRWSSGEVIKMLGCSFEELDKYLEKLFYDHPETNDPRYPSAGHKMTKDNYGSGYNRWHIDHIIPLASIKEESLEDLKKLWHYTNLQPLWCWDNLRKGAKI